MQQRHKSSVTVAIILRNEMEIKKNVIKVIGSGDIKTTRKDWIALSPKGTRAHNATKFNDYLRYCFSGSPKMLLLGIHDW